MPTFFNSMRNRIILASSVGLAIGLGAGGLASSLLPNLSLEQSMLWGGVIGATTLGTIEGTMGLPGMLLRACYNAAAGLGTQLERLTAIFSSPARNPLELALSEQRDAIKNLKSIVIPPSEMVSITNALTEGEEQRNRSTVMIEEALKPDESRIPAAASNAEPSTLPSCDPDNLSIRSTDSEGTRDYKKFQKEVSQRRIQSPNVSGPEFFNNSNITQLPEDSDITAIRSAPRTSMC